MKVYFCETAAGTHHAYDKKQNEQRKPDDLHRTVDIHNNAPYRAALKLLWDWVMSCQISDSFSFHVFRAFSKFCTTQLSDK